MMIFVALGQNLVHVTEGRPTASCLKVVLSVNGGMTEPVAGSRLDPTWMARVLSR